MVRFFVVPESIGYHGTAARSPAGAGSGAEGGDEEARALGPGAVLASRYEVRALLGEGGMGAVYRVHDRLRGTDVALKVMRPSLVGRPEAAARFRNEAELALRLAHEHVVRLYDVGEDPERRLRFYTMELVEGVSLRDRLTTPSGAGAGATGRALEPREALAIFEQIVEALVYAHRMGVIHRDLKPENIMLARDGSGVKVLDFGIAKLAPHPGPLPGGEGGAAPSVGEGRTGASRSLGTAYYMAPEQRADASAADARADIFAACVILYEMLTGDVPVGRWKTPTEEGKAVPRRLDDVVLRGLEPARERRFATAAELLAEVRAIRAAVEGTRAGEAGSRRAVLVGAVAVALLAVAGAVVGYAVLGWGRADAPAPPSPPRGEGRGEGAPSSTPARARAPEPVPVPDAGRVPETLPSPHPSAPPLAPPPAPPPPPAPAPEANARVLEARADAIIVEATGDAFPREEDPLARDSLAVQSARRRARDHAAKALSEAPYGLPAGEARRVASAGEVEEAVRVEGGRFRIIWKVRLGEKAP